MSMSQRHNERGKKASSSTYHPYDYQPTSEKIGRKRRRNGRVNSRRPPEIQEDTNQELHMYRPNHQQSHSPSFQQQQPSNSLSQYPPENGSLAEPSGGFFTGSKDVGVSGGNFTQTYGAHTTRNLTVHIHQLQKEVEYDIPEMLRPLLTPPPSSTSSPPFLSPEQPPTRESSRSASQTSLPPAHALAHDAHHSQLSFAAKNRQDSSILRRDYDWNTTYTTQFLLQNRGYPLWITEPNGNLPLSYRRQGTRIGDVGILTPSGGFSFLFNICLPSGHAINQQRVPEGFAPIDPPVGAMDIVKYREFKDMAYLASPAIEEVHSDPSFMGLSFQTSADGAILTLPEGAVRLDLENIAQFRAYAAANIESWYRYVNGARGREVKNGEIRLVIGCDKATSWGMAAVASSAQPKTHCLKYCSREGNQMISASSARLYKWEYTGLVSAKVGPDLIDIEELSRNDDSNSEVEGKYCNQCLFVRTLNISLDDGVFARINQELGSPLILESQQRNHNNSPNAKDLSNRDPQNTNSRYGTNLGIERGSTGRSSEASTDRIFVSNIGNMGHVATSTTPTTLSFHPADYLNKLISHKVSRCRVVITQDHDWCSIISKNDKTMPSPKEIAERALAAHYIREEDGVVFLEPKETQLMTPRRQIPSSTSAEEHPDLEDAIERPPGFNVSTSPAHENRESSSFLFPGYSTLDLSKCFRTLLDHPLDSGSSKIIQNPQEIDISTFSSTSGIWDHFAPSSSSDPISKGIFKRERSVSVLNAYIPLPEIKTPKDPEDIQRILSDWRLPRKIISSPAVRQSAEKRRKIGAAFSCELCGATFTRNHNRINHIRAHTGKAGVKCSFCGRHLAKSSLARHQRNCRANNANRDTTSEWKSTLVQATAGSNFLNADNGLVLPRFEVKADSSLPSSYSPQPSHVMRWDSTPRLPIAILRPSYSCSPTLSTTPLSNTIATAIPSW